jgi:hypothetical protein
MNVSKIFNRIKNYICNKKPYAKIEPENILTQRIINKVKKYEDANAAEYELAKTRSQIGNIIVYRSRPNLHIEKIDKIQPIDEWKEEPAEKIENILDKPIKIKVNMDIITAAQYEKIIEKYNEITPKSWQPLERLPRAEGGFQLEIPEKKDIKCSENQKIKQLRWNKKCLVPYKNYIGFNVRETELLFNTMKSVFGENVTLENA